MKLDLSKRTVSSDKFNEVTEKVKEKEYSLLKLRNQLFDKDTIISEKEDEVKKLSGRITEINKEHEKKMENRAFDEINNQNNLRHQLLSQQYEMKKTLLAEQEKLRLEIEADKIQAENKLRDELKSIEQALLMKLSSMEEKVQQKKLLLQKVKKTLLYKPSSGRGEEKGNVPTEKLQLGYCWPLELYSGPQIEEPASYELSQDLVFLLKERPSFSLENCLGTFTLASSKTNKRKLNNIEHVLTKRLRLSEPVLMIDFCWPIVLYKGKKSMKLTINHPLSAQSVIKIPERLPALQNPSMTGFKRKLSEDVDESPLASKRVKSEQKPLMISYAWPLVIYEPRNIMIDSRIEMIDTFSSSLNMNILPKFETVDWQPVSVSPLLMITYSDKSHHKDSSSQNTSSKRKSSECEEHEQDSKRFKSFADIPCYKYKIVAKLTRSNKCLQSPGLCSPKKVINRRYQAPVFKKTTSQGRKRSFLDFLEDLSPEEMQDLHVDEVSVYALDAPVIVVKPKSKKPRFTSSLLLEMPRDLLVTRRMSQKLLPFVYSSLVINRYIRLCQLSAAIPS